MNAFRPTVSRVLTRTVRKISTNHPSFVPKQYQSNFKKDFLSDPSTYPVIAITMFSLSWMVGMGINAMSTYKDVRVDPKKRNALVRDWGEDEYEPLLGKMVYWNSWQKHAPEGLGVSHEEWLKQKRTYYSEDEKVESTK